MIQANCTVETVNQAAKVKSTIKVSNYNLAESLAMEHELRKMLQKMHDFVDNLELKEGDYDIEHTD